MLALFRHPFCLAIAMAFATGCETNSEDGRVELAALSETGTTLEVRRPLSESEIALASQTGLLPEVTQSILLTGPMSHGDFAWNEAGIEEGQITVWVDIQRQTVSVFRGGHEIGTALIIYGAPGYETPLGTFPIISKIEDYHSKTYDAPMPYSLFLNDQGVAIHSSEVTNRNATHGCIGLPEAFAKKLFEVVTEGDRVTIVRST